MIKEVVHMQKTTVMDHHKNVSYPEGVNLKMLSTGYISRTLSLTSNVDEGAHSHMEALWEGNPVEVVGRRGVCH